MSCPLASPKPSTQLLLGNEGKMCKTCWGWGMADHLRAGEAALGQPRLPREGSPQVGSLGPC